MEDDTVPARMTVFGKLFSCALALLCMLAFLTPLPLDAAELAGHPVRSHQYWGQAWKARPLAGRVAPAPEEVLDYVFLDTGGEEGDATQPRPVVCEDMQALAGRALEDIAASLPLHLRRLLEERLTGIFLARELGSTGYVEAATSPEGPLAFIVIDAELLKGRTANAWASLREGSFFRPSPAVEVSMAIAAREDDTPLQGMRYILLHELGHSLGIMTGVHPDWNSKPRADAPQRYPFVGLSWTVRDGRYAARFQERFSWRSELRIYAFEEALLSARQAPQVYDDLAGTNWPSLYAAVSPFEDFAESFAVWQHAVREERPWLVTVSQGELRRHHASCLVTGTCPDKAAFMARWFAAAQ